MATVSVALFGLPRARSVVSAGRRVAARCFTGSDFRRRQQRPALLRICSASNRAGLFCCSSKMGVPTAAEPAEKNEIEANPLLNVGCFPPFDKIEAKHIVPGIRQIIKELEDDLAKLEENVKPSWESLVPPLERIVDRLTVSWGAVEHLKAVKDSTELRSAVEEIQPEKVAYFLKLGQSKPLYSAFKQIREGPAYETLSESQKRIVEDQLKSAVLGGVALEDDKRARFNEIEQELEQLGTKFSDHVLDSTKKYEKLITDKSEIEGLPPTALGLAAQTAASKGHEGATSENGPWMITLAFPSYEPVMKHVKNRALREEVYRAYITRASEGDLDNTPVINRFLELRTQKAKLLGYKNYAEVSMVRKMATPETAEELIEKLRACSWDGAVKDLEELKAFAREQKAPEAEDLGHWDVTFWSERLRESKFDINEEELRPYFSLPKVMEGLFGLAKQLFSIEVEAADGAAPVWDNDVKFFRVKDLSGEPVAYFYFDPYARPAEKRSGAWMDIVVGRSCTLAPEGRHVRLPVAHMVCNQTPPVGDDPSLMTFREVETLFHEFGHALQHMLTKQDEGLVAGIQGIEWDAVELPSQFMENWCYHKKTLMSFAVHYKTGEPLPVALYEKLNAARTFRAASLMLRQLHFASIDLELHTRFQVGGAETIYDVNKRVAQKTMVIPPLPEDRFLCSFLHIFTAGSYAAGYYSYKWAEVLSADAFGAFEDAGLEDEHAVKETGQRFRNTILALGGGKAPLEVFKEFRGREPTTDALLRHSGLLPSVAA